MIVIDLPKCEHVRAQLSELKTQRVYFEPLSGNNGDKLIEVATRHLFAELDLNLVRDPEQADSIVVIGGGWFHHLYPPHCETLTRLSQTYSDRPLYVLPISISIEAAQARAVFQGRTAPTYLYLRERPSYELACQAGLPESVRLFMDHDMAFCIQDSPYLRRLRQIAREQYILVVERIDPESVTGLQYQPFRSNRLVKKFTPSPPSQGMDSARA